MRCGSRSSTRVRRSSIDPTVSYTDRSCSWNGLNAMRSILSPPRSAKTNVPNSAPRSCSNGSGLPMRIEWIHISMPLSRIAPGKIRLNLSCRIRLSVSQRALASSIRTSWLTTGCALDKLPIESMRTTNPPRTKAVLVVLKLPFICPHLLAPDLVVRAKFQGT